LRVLGDELLRRGQLPVGIVLEPFRAIWILQLLGIRRWAAKLSARARFVLNSSSELPVFATFRYAIGERESRPRRA